MWSKRTCLRVEGGTGAVDLDPDPHALNPEAPIHVALFGWTAEAAIVEQAEVVRELKEGQGLGNQDPLVAVAVAELLVRKERVASMKAAISAAAAAAAEAEAAAGAA